MAQESGAQAGVQQTNRAFMRGRRLRSQAKFLPQPGQSAIALKTRYLSSVKILAMLGLCGNWVI